LTSTSIGFSACPLASARVLSPTMACLVADESVFASIATIAGAATPFEKASSMRWIVGTVGALFGSASRPLCAVCRWNTGSASTISTPPASAAAATGCARVGLRIAFQKRLPPASFRSRCTNGIRPLSTRGPSFDSRAGSTVSEPSIATPTTIIVAIPNERYVLSPAKNSPAIAISTVKPEMSTDRPEVAAAAASAADGSRPAARSSRQRLM